MGEVNRIPGQRDVNNRLTRINEITGNLADDLAAVRKDVAALRNPPYQVIFDLPYGVAVVNAPAAAQTINNNNAIWYKLDLSGFTELRVGVHVVTPSVIAVQLKVCYSPTSVVWTPATAAAGLVTNAAGWLDTGWNALVTAARGLVWLTIQTSNGNGLGGSSPVLGHIQIQAR